MHENGTDTPYLTETEEPVAQEWSPPPFNAVVQVFVQSIRPSAIFPWKDYTQPQSSGSGFVIDDERIMTCAHVVADATQIMVKKPSSEDKYIAQVLYVNHDSDLALLRVVDQGFFVDTAPLQFSGLPALQSSVLVVGYPVGGENMSYTQGIVSRIEPTTYVHTMRSLLAIQIDANVNHGNSGGPVFAEDHTVVGVAFQGQAENNIYQIIPTTVIEHFLVDIQDDCVDGVADCPFEELARMENKDMRSAFGMQDGQSGILVCKLTQGAKSQDLFKVNDVLLSVDGKKIANNGRIRSMGHSFDFRTFLESKQLNQTVRFEILRAAAQLTVDYRLCKLPSPCKEFQFDYAPTYYISGGLVFTLLTSNYLMEMGKNASRILFDEREESFEEGDETVLLSLVLADEVNLGYQDHAGVQVVKVNNEKLHTLRELVQKIEAQKTGMITLLLANDKPIILDVQKMKAATPRILKQYRIVADRSTDIS